MSFDAMSAHRPHAHIPLRNIVFRRLFGALFKVLNRFVPWYQLGWRLGLLNLIILRNELQAKNLIDTEEREATPQASDRTAKAPEEERTSRTFDGTFNDLNDPMMGAVGSTFGRNMAPKYQPQFFDLPDPITVSRELMNRDVFIPAQSLNLLAAAWIQFQVHDWVNHARHTLGDPKHDIVIPMRKGEQWVSYEIGPKENVMRIAGNEVLRCTPEGYPVFKNATTPWWDASEIYGATEKDAINLREGARIRLGTACHLPVGQDGNVVTGFNESWWLGLGIFHTLFAREHNAICDQLKKEYPDWDEDRIYQTARLIVSALIAKIHILEWTPSILASKTIELGMRSTWCGAPKDWLHRLFIWLLDTQALKGMPGSPTDHHNVPYSLTEEFVSVYRMHPLIPDDYCFLNHKTGQQIHSLKFEDIQGPNANGRLREIKVPNAIYSFGIAHPGAIALHNYPTSLQKFKRQNGEIIDLSVVDIVRDRMRGVPRYNDFREGVHKPRICRWDELSNDPEIVDELKDLYADIDQVDTMVGLYAEPPPEGFGFSDTAFRIFLLMATRRLQSDRFLTIDFRPEVYTKLGMDWIEKNSMTSVILRHFPELDQVLPKMANAFTPWRQARKAI